ncbi:GH92 family glycosyl hydrolase [Pedobacter nutrimenti]|uniref:GH92 family glycosyl hydrolase n=1 Tax=Pedobacter nutrimenti TaxID=1241337 RepID=UPI00292FD5D9|nr:GH92 family glycosyl hydrolase [Pedobacter nutrimenti]
MSNSLLKINFTCLSALFFYIFLIPQASHGQVHLNSPVDEVNPLIGTTGNNSTEYGGLIPAVAPPFAMTQWCAQTRESSISSTSYHYNDKSIMGFTATHQPAIWMGDYGMVTICPQSGQLYTNRKRAMTFSHEDEKTTPYGYSVRMNAIAGGIIKANLAATSRAGLLSFSFPKSDSSFIFVEASRQENFVGWIEYDSLRNELIGYNPDRQSAHLGPPLPGFKGYFVVRFNKKPTAFGTTYHESIFKGKSQQSGDRCGAFLRFVTGDGDSVLVKTGTSFISIEQARSNLDLEIPGWKLETVQEQTKKEWNRYLARIKIDGGSKDNRTCFYTALYRTMQYPREFSEYGRYYSAFDDRIHQGISYNDYSLWDTFRAEHPLLNLLMPEKTGGMIQALLQMYKEGGWLPKWPNPTYTNIMIATHADAVIADAMVKGIKGFDKSLAWEAVKKDAFVAPSGDSTNKWGDRAPWTAYEARGGLTWYNKMGYIPSGRTNENVSRTIEYSYDDWCVAQVARLTGHPSDFKFLMNRSKNYQNTYDRRSGFFISRYENGSFVPENRSNEGMTEGSKWTYLFGAMHDIPGLIKLMGGAENFEKRLDENFDSSHYQHDNEPGHHYIYLYNYIGKPEKTQSRIYQYTPINYKNTPDGLLGNDDCGQMSAWLVFTSIGFYPVCPGSSEYAIGVPLFDHIQITVKSPSGQPHQLTIERKNYAPSKQHVKRVLLDGKKHNGLFFKHNELLNARTIIFEME